MRVVLAIRSTETAAPNRDDGEPALREVPIRQPARKAAPTLTQAAGSEEVRQGVQL